jgi:hypothetical protein
VKMNIDGLQPVLAIHSPNVIGAAMRILALGGSKLSESERAMACGSKYLLTRNGEAIMTLVATFEERLG